MINLLLLLLFITCLGIVAAWMAENPGSVTIHWFDYRIDTSFAFLLAAALTAAIVVTCSTLIIRRLTLWPKQASQARRLKYQRLGLTELTYGVAALASGDIADAESHTKHARKLLGGAPLVLLLSAQIARSRGDDDATRTLLEQMLAHEETEYLAARSLSEAASKQQIFPKALALAQRAEAINPKAGTAVISLHTRLGQWQEAMLAIDKAMRKGLLTRAQRRRYQGIVHIEEGIQLLANHSPAAPAVARQALKELPGFVPAIVLAARAFAADGQNDKALQLILRSWKKSPHQQLAGQFHLLLVQEPLDRQKKLAGRFIAMHSKLPPAAIWTCSACGYISKTWEAHCPACGGFDTVEDQGIVVRV